MFLPHARFPKNHNQTCLQVNNVCMTKFLEHNIISNAYEYIVIVEIMDSANCHWRDIINWSFIQQKAKINAHVCYDYKVCK